MREIGNFKKNGMFHFIVVYTIVTILISTTFIGFCEVGIGASSPSSNDPNGLVTTSVRGGGPGNMNWTLISNFTMGVYTGIDVGSYSKPAFADLDNDLDYDLTVGESGGTLEYFQNIGTVSTPSFAAPVKLKSGGVNINLGSPSKPSFPDLDGDGDFDLVIGEGFGKLYYYQNTGTVNSPIWTSGGTLKSGGFDIKKGGFATPSFADLDNDADLDLTFGDWLGGIYCYENTGTAASPVWTENTTMYSSVTLNASSVYVCPELTDVDDDGDYDLTVGEDWGFLYFFENTGDAVSPNWTENKAMYEKVGVLEWAGPAFADLFNDGDLDLTIGDINGTLTLYENEIIFVKKIRMTLSLTNGGGASGKTCYAKYKPYTFKVRARSSEGVNDIKAVNLTLDYLGQQLEYKWDNATRQFQELNDPNDYTELVSTPADATNDTVKTWTLNFKLKFNWSYPDEDLHAVQVYCEGYSPLYSWLNLTNLYRVENDLVFTGDLSVVAEFQGLLTSGDWVRQAENLSWGGLKVVYEQTTTVYPADPEFEVTLWDDDGDSWVDTASSGKNITINSTADLTTDNNDTHIINITKIPSYCTNASLNFTIRVDADQPTYTDPTPDPNIWQTTLSPTCGITVTDNGGSLVSAASIEYRVSLDNGSTWLAWTNAGETLDALSIISTVTPAFQEGQDNLMRWKADDVVGNGYNVSEDNRIIIDVTEVSFENPSPNATDLLENTTVNVGITVLDIISGVDAETIEYSIKKDGETVWSNWLSAGKTNDAPQIDCSLQLIFNNGTENYIRWQAKDIAGNGYAGSPEYQIMIDTRLANLAPEVTLQAPADLNTVTTTTPTLTWNGIDTDSTTINYYVYLGQDQLKVTDHDNSVLVSYQQALTYTSTTPLPDAATYYWTVIPHDGITYGPCLSGVWAFEIDISVPSPVVTLLMPTDGEIIVGTSLELSWSVNYSGTETVEYDLYFDTISTPANLVSEGQTATSYQATGLIDKTKYYWKVIPTAGNVEGTCVSGEWSFTIALPEIVPTVTLLQPLDGSKLAATSVTLSWRLDYAGSEAITFDVYLDTSSIPENKASDAQSETEFTVTDLEDGTKYYWKVGLVVGGVGGVYESEIWSFEVDIGFVQIYKVNLTLDKYELTLTQGEQATLDVTLTNEGNSVDAIVISLVAEGLGSNIELERSDEDIILDTDEAITLKLTISTTNTTAAKNYSIIITASSKGDILEEAYDTKTVAVEVKKIDGDVVPDDEPPETPGKTKKSEIDIFSVLIAISIIIIIVLITYFIHFRKKREPKPETAKAASPPKSTTVPQLGLTPSGQPPTLPPQPQQPPTIQPPTVSPIPPQPTLAPPGSLTQPQQPQAELPSKGDKDLPES